MAKTLFHTTSVPFNRFLERPTWFSTSIRDARKWHGTGIGPQTTYVCQLRGNAKLASVEQCALLARQVWPRDDFVYSMLDVKIGEFLAVDIERFILLMEQQGFVGTYLEDYDPDDYEGDSGTRSLCIFKPATRVRIVRPMAFRIAASIT